MVKALILGGANCVFEDEEKARRLGEFDIVICANDIGTKYRGRIDHWVSLHPEKMGDWMKSRQRERLNMDFQSWSHETKRDTRIDSIFPYDWGREGASGSSGLYAVKVAIVALKCERAVLCGVPMRAENGHFFNPDPWDQAPKYADIWKLPQVRKGMGNKVRSMSGWTARLLGKPTQTWLEGADEPPVTDPTVDKP